MGKTLRFLLPAELDDAGRNAELMRLFCKYYQRYPKATGWIEDVHPDERGWVGNTDRGRKVYCRDRVEEIVMTHDRRRFGVIEARFRQHGKLAMYNLTINGRLWACVA